MKKYRCKIDSPFGGKGEIYSGELLFKKEGRSSLVKAYPDLFEEIHDRWIPEKGQVYYFVTLGARNKCHEICYNNWVGDDLDLVVLKEHNIFRTKEKAQEVLDNILKLLEDEKEV